MLFWGDPTQGSDANHASAVQEALATVRDCMDHCPPPWPDAWRREYLEAIRDAISPNPSVSQYDRRLQMLREGFALYWPDIKNTPDRSFFEVRRAQIRWYAENLMASTLPNQEETALIRRQYENLANHAAEGLGTQFSFLDPNRISEAKAAWLADCRRKVEAPLLPVFLTPFSQSQLERMKERWHDLRYARVDLWRSLGRRPAAANRDTSSSQAHPDCLLAQRSFDQWQGCFWDIATVSPDYCRAALAGDIDAQKRRNEAMSRARREESHLSNAAVQTEYFSFLLGALMETAREESSKPPDRQDAATQRR